MMVRVNPIHHHWKKSQSAKGVETSRRAASFPVDEASSTAGGSET